MTVYCILLQYLVSFLQGQKDGVKYSKLAPIIQFLVAICCLCIRTECKLEEKLIKVSLAGNDCICPGDNLTYECTVVGDYGGFTVWTGDFIHCSNGKRVIELQHSPSTNSQGGVSSTRMCNDGNIVGRIITIENGSFISQLNVTVTSEIAGRTIDCAYDNGTIHRIGSINLTTEFAPSSSSVSISWSATRSEFYTFNWNMHSPNCLGLAIHYNTLASNCGSCPTTTNHTNVTCTDVPTDGSTCTFAIQSVICGIITGVVSQVSLLNINTPGSSESKSALISAVCLGVALFVCLIGLITVIIHLIKSKTKVVTMVTVVNTAAVDKAQSASTSATQSSCISTKKNISYVVHSPKTASDVTTM